MIKEAWSIRNARLCFNENGASAVERLDARGSAANSACREETSGDCKEIIPERLVLQLRIDLRIQESRSQLCW